MEDLDRAMQQRRFGTQLLLDGLPGGMVERKTLSVCAVVEPDEDGNGGRHDDR